MPFDFSHTNIGTMPDEDIYARLGPESMFGITPTMRADINRRDAQDRQDELMYRQLASQGNPLALALAYPDRFFRQTGQYYDTDLNDQPILRSTYDTPEYRAAQRASWLAEGTAKRSGEAVNSAIRDMMLSRDIEAYNSPTATALRQLDPETAKRLVLSQTGYTKTYGYGGAPSESQSAQELARINQGPATTRAETERRQFEAEGPEREFKLRAGEKTLAMKETEQKLDALGKELESLRKALETEYTPEGRAKIITRMGEISKEMRGIVGIRTEETPAKVDPREAQAQPERFKGKTFIGTDAKGRRRLFRSDGTQWVDIGPAPA